MPNMSEGDPINQAEEIIKKNQKGKDFFLRIFGATLRDKRNGKCLSPEDERAIMLRDHCVEVIRLLNNFLDNPVLERKVEDIPESALKLAAKISLLRYVGITEDGFQEQNPEKFIDDQLKIAEYVSSGLLWTFGDLNPYIRPTISAGGHLMSQMTIKNSVEYADRFIGERMGTSFENHPKR